MTGHRHKSLVNRCLLERIRLQKNNQTRRPPIHLKTLLNKVNGVRVIGFTKLLLDVNPITLTPFTLTSFTRSSGRRGSRLMLR